MARIDRSEFIKIHQKKDKGRCYNTTMLPVIEKTFQDRYIFSRDGDNLYCEVPVSFATATLGGNLDIPPLNGRAN